MALTLVLPNPVAGTPAANAADVAPTFALVRITTKVGTQIILQTDSGAATPLSATPADPSRFTILVDGQSNAVTAVSNGPDCSSPSNCYIITLTLTNKIFAGAVVTIEYSDAGTADRIKSHLGTITPKFGPLSVTNRSEAVASVPATPGVATVVAGEESATITVTAPSSGIAPTSYIATASPGGKTCTVSSASGSCTIDGLTAGVAYTFTTVAINAAGSSTASAPSSPVIVLAKGAGSTTGLNTDSTTGSNTASWDVEPATESEFDTNTEGLFPNPLPGMSIITNEFGFVIDKKGGIKPKIRMRSYAGRISMTITAKYKDGGKNKNYKCTFKPFGTTKKVKSVKWRWYTPKKACILPKPLITAVQKGETTISAKGKWSRQWLTSGKKARPDRTKIKPRTLKYTMRAKPAVVK
jgi:hypothetical protein